MTKRIVTQKRLKELMHYNPETGIFSWLTSGKGRKESGKAGTIMLNGYISICIDYKRYLAHRLAFLYMTGAWPADQVDHDNQVRNDNFWDNLNQATNITNSRNHSMPSDNTSGCVGVGWHKARSKWRARIRDEHLGIFTDKVDAIAARKAAEIKYGFHPNHGK